MSVPTNSCLNHPLCSAAKRDRRMSGLFGCDRRGQRATGFNLCVTHRKAAAAAATSLHLEVFSSICLFSSTCCFITFQLLDDVAFWLEKKKKKKEEEEFVSKRTCSCISVLGAARTVTNSGPQVTFGPQCLYSWPRDRYQTHFRMLVWYLGVSIRTGGPL